VTWCPLTLALGFSGEPGDLAPGLQHCLPIEYQAARKVLNEWEGEKSPELGEQAGSQTTSAGLAVTRVSDRNLLEVRVGWGLRERNLESDIASFWLHFLLGDPGKLVPSLGFSFLTY
jgi:hypothetical protein